jgi:UDP-arabinose 4-epimerase
MTNVLVTGGAGYIGAHACKALAAAGYRPVVFDNLVYGHREAVKWGPLIEGDLADRAAVEAAIAAHDIAAVMHFAAYAYVGESIEEPAKYYRNNLFGTLNLLEAMRAAGLDKLVFSSTCATYGVPETMPIREDTEQRPINPYGHSKLMCEQIIRDFAAAYGLRCVMPRYFNACGADPDGEIGEDHEPEPHLIPLALRAADGGTPLTVFGEDYPTPDGTCIRDYIHVTDLAEAHVAALDYLVAGGETLAVNLGTGRGISVRELLGAVEQVTGQAVRHSVGPRRPGDPAVLVADPALAAATLDWKARKSDIATIVETAWAWHRLRNRA